MGAGEPFTIETEGGRTLEVLLSGPDDGTVLVFHTGSPGGLVPLPPGLDPAAMGIRTVLYARPGYGRSTPHPGRTVADAAQDVATVLDALGVEKFLNIGWSGGGPHALACDAGLPDRCQATALIAGLAPYEGPDTSDEVMAYFADDEENQLALSGDVDGFRKAIGDFVAGFADLKPDDLGRDNPSAGDRRFFAAGYAEWIAGLLRTSGVSGGDGAADDFLAFFADWGFPLSAIRPLTIWQGTEDANVPPFHSVWLRDHLPHAVLRLLEGEGHSSIVEHLPEIITTMIS
jgi:pimeloyl-ACP methyl ester carboxylesterase